MDLVEFSLTPAVITIAYRVIKVWPQPQVSLYHLPPWAAISHAIIDNYSFFKQKKKSTNKQKNPANKQMK